MLVSRVLFLFVCFLFLASCCSFLVSVFPFLVVVFVFCCVFRLFCLLRVFVAFSHDRNSRSLATYSGLSGVWSFL